MQFAIANKVSGTRSWARVGLAAGIALLAGLLLTAAAVRWQQRTDESEARLGFERHVDRTQADILRRFNQTVFGLKGARGVFAAHPRSTGRGAFRAYVESRDLALEFPGVRGFGFAQRVLRNDLDAFIAAERADDAADFRVHPGGDAADLYVIKYIEPLSANYPAWGFDLGSEALRREAIERAADTGEPTLSGRVTLLQDGRQGAGFLYFLPVFREGADPTTPRQRRQTMAGLLYSPIVARELLVAAVESEDRAIDFRLYDGADTAEGDLVFDSQVEVDGLRPGLAGTDVASSGRFTTARALVVGGRALTLRATSTPLFDGQVRSTPSHWLWAAGSLLSGLLALSVSLLVSGRQRALALAQAMTADLDRLAKVAQRTSNAVVITGADRRITWVNDGFTRITGYTADEALGRFPGALLQCESTDPDTVAALRAALNDGQAVQCQIENRSKAGRTYWLELEIQPLRGAAGALTGFMAIQSDITEARRAADELAQERRRLAHILEGTNVGTWEWSVQTGEYRCNERWAQMVGYTLEELVPVSAETWSRLAHPADLRRAGRLIQRHFAGEVDYFEHEVRLRHKDGRWVWVLDRGRVSSWTADGRPERMSGTQMDISARKADEAALRDSRAFLNRAGRLAGMGGWQLDLATQVLSWSEETYRIHDLPLDHRPSVDEAIGFYAPEARPLIRQAVQEGMKQGTPWDLELAFVTATGRRLWVRAIGEAQHEDGKVVRLLGAFQDITARRAMEDELRQRDAVKQSILDSLPCGLSVFDGELNLVTHNAQLRRLLQLPHDLAGQRLAFADILDRSAGGGVPAGGSGAWWAERSAPWRFERKCADGRTLEIRGAPMPGGGLVTTYTDVTERCRTDAALQQTSALLQSVLDAASEVAVIATDAELRITVFNKGAERLLGYAAGEVVGRLTPAVFADPAEALARSERFSAELGRPIRGPAVVLAPELLGREQEWTFIRKDRSTVQVSMVVTALQAGSGRASGFLGVAHDVTRRKQHEDSLREATRRAEEASLAKSRFLANMSHEIRTPMNAVLGMLRLLQKTSLTPRQLDYADKTEGAARSLLGLLNDILDFSKVEAGKMVLEAQPFRCDKLLRDLSVILAANLGGKPVELRFDIDPTLPRELVGDAMRLQQVLINLGGNAIKFTSAGEVVVGVRVLAREPGHATLEIAVRDTGIGIAAEHHALIFEGFAQAESSTTRRFGGTGLGLPICQRLVALMGSELRLQSEPGAGSRFWFELRLPVGAGEGAAAALASGPAAVPLPSGDGALLPAPGPAPGGPGVGRLAGLRLLLVEDNANNRQVARELLCDEGAEVELAEHGREGVERVLRSPAAFDAVLMDLQMPVMDGYTATAEIRRHVDAARLPIVAMTANALKSDREACLAAGMNDHVGKPFDLDHLVLTLLRHVRRAGAAAAAPGRTAPPLPEAVVALAARHGLAVPAAVQRLGGNLAAYARLLAGFRGELADLPARLSVLLAAGDRAEARRLVHTLKGSAATLGAGTLAAAAAAAEKRLAAPGEPDEGPSEDLARAAADALAGLEPLAALLAAAHAATPAPAGATADAAALTRSLAELETLLLRSDLRALEVHAALKSGPGAGLPEALRPLDAAIAALDFAQAAAQCRSLIDHHDH